MSLIAEWEPQSRVLFSFPRRDGDWGTQLAAASGELADLIAATARFVPVSVVCGDWSWAQQYAERMGVGEREISSSVSSELIELPTNDCWIRDFGPISRVQGSDVKLLDFRFNGWGGKFPAELDNRLNARLWAAGRLGERALRSLPWVLEGGSLETDGRGTLLTTERCLLNPNRNPQWSKTELEAQLRASLGVNRIVWLKSGELIGDDTDAHIDTLARFCGPKTIAYVRCKDSTDAHYAGLRAMEKELRGAFPAHELVPLPLPTPLYDETDGHRLPATYANFLLTNGAVIVPTYGVQTDELVGGIFQELFSDRDVILLPSRALVHQHGSFHCLSMNLY